MNNQRNFGNKRINNRKINYGNKKLNQNPIQTQTTLPRETQTILPQYVNSSSNPSTDNSNIITTIILLVLFIIIIFVIYYYWEKIYNYVSDKFSIFMGTNDTYYLMESEEEKKDKIKCKSGCVKGKCNSKEGVCKDDNECILCLDKDGSIYGAAPTKDDNKLKAMEEEDILQNKRITELEEMIKNRNKQIEDLNKYIDYVNKNKDKINKEKIKEIYEEENKNFLVKVNYS